MDNVDVVIFIVVGMVMLFFLKSMFKNLGQVIFVIMAVILAYTFLSGNASFLTSPRLEKIFDGESVESMQSLYCGDSNNKRSKAVCSCIVNPVYQELHNTFSVSEIEVIEQDQERMNILISKIIDKQRGLIETCLDEKEASSLGIISKFKKSRDIWNL